MPIVKQYNAAEVTALLELYENAQNVITGNNKPAHALTKHSTTAALKQRIQQGNLCPSAYVNKKTLADATVEVLNSPAGQSALRRIDEGTSDREQIEHDFVKKYSAVAEYGDEFRFPLGLVNANETGKGQVFRGHLGASGVGNAVTGIVLVERYTKHQIWIQTSYPLV